MSRPSRAGARDKRHHDVLNLLPFLHIRAQSCIPIVIVAHTMAIRYELPRFGVFWRRLFPEIFEEFLHAGEEAFAFGMGHRILASLFEFAQ